MKLTNKEPLYVIGKATNEGYLDIVYGSLAHSKKRAWELANLAVDVPQAIQWLKDNGYNVIEVTVTSA